MLSCRRSGCTSRSDRTSGRGTCSERRRPRACRSRASRRDGSSGRRAPRPARYPAVKHYRLLEDGAREQLPSISSWSTPRRTSSSSGTYPPPRRSSLQRSVTMGWAMIHRLLIVDDHQRDHGILAAQRRTPAGEFAAPAGARGRRRSRALSRSPARRHTTVSASTIPPHEVSHRRRDPSRGRAGRRRAESRTGGR